MKRRNCFAAIWTAILMLVSFSMFPALADNLYKWVDDKGNVTYQGSPPPEDAAKVEKSTLSTGEKEVREQAEKAEPVAKNVEPVTFYSKTECPPCKAAREYFEANGIPFNEINLTENKDEADALDEKLGYSSVPTFLIGKKYISGFEKVMLKSILTKDGYAFPKEEENE